MMRSLIVLFSATLLAAGLDKLPRNFELARTRYYQAIDGDEAAYRSALTLFPSIACEHPELPLVNVYYGSLLLLEASHTWQIWNKNKLSRQGMALMDRAVQMQPSNLEIRFVRAVTTYHLPAFFHRSQQSNQDFAYLAQHAVEAARTGSLEPRLAAASLYFHGEALHRAGRDEMARKSWQDAIAVAPESPAARGARDALEALKH